MTYDTHPDSDQRSGGRRGGVLGRILGLAAIVLVAAIAVAAVSWLTRSTHTSTEGISDGFSRVEIDVDAGTVEIVGSASGEATIEVTTESGWFADAEVTHEIEDGDTLRVEGACGGSLILIQCRTDVVLTVPDDVEVVAHSSAGRLLARGLAGPTDLDSSAGSVTVEDQSGDLTAHSSAGGVHVDGLSADEAKVTSSAGAVTIAATEPPRSLDAESSAGRVHVVLPAGEEYDVDAESSAGSTDVEVDTSQDSRYKIRAFSSAGAVTVTDE